MMIHALYRFFPYIVAHIWMVKSSMWQKFMKSKYLNNEPVFEKSLEY